MTGQAQTHRPKSLKKGGETRLDIVWEDGHHSSYNTAVLRRACPCAGCVNEWTGEQILDPLQVLETAKPVRIEPVGRYAIRIVWNDLHDSGIYTFDHLRSLCPCDECQK